MTSVLLPIIYISFISLGLPDSILGAAWPTMYQGLGVSVSSAGLIAMIISASTVVSALSAEWLHSKLSTGKITFLSVTLTAMALYGFSVSQHFELLCILAIPYGLGAGGVDAVLNNYVALHYKARHMSWLHSMWGIGTSLGPIIMAQAITQTTWHDGYKTISALQLALVIALFFSIRLWNDDTSSMHSEPQAKMANSLRSRLAIPGVKQVLVCFFSYCALETTTGMWAASYCTFHRGIPAELTSRWASLFYLGITGGRILSGFITFKLNERNMVRLGQLFIFLGLLLLFLPLGNTFLLSGLLFVGFGCAPIFPSLLHETPKNFGIANSQGIIGLQMASAYLGTTLFPLVFGILAQDFSFALYPIFLGAIFLVMFFMSEWLHRKTKRVYV